MNRKDTKYSEDNEMATICTNRRNRQKWAKQSQIESNSIQKIR